MSDSQAAEFYKLYFTGGYAVIEHVKREQEGNHIVESRLTLYPYVVYHDDWPQHKYFFNSHVECLAYLLHRAGVYAENCAPRGRDYAKWQRENIASLYKKAGGAGEGL